MPVGSGDKNGPRSKGKDVDESLDALNVTKQYNRKYNEAKKLLVKIEKKLIKHKKEFDKSGGNWGYVGDMGNWVELLNGINNPG